MVNDLMCLIVNTDLAAYTLTHHEVGDHGLFHYIVVLRQTSEGDVHILVALGEHIYGAAIVTVVLIPVDGLLREGLEVTVIVFNTGLIDDHFTGFDKLQKSTSHF